MRYWRRWKNNLTPRSEVVSIFAAWYTVDLSVGETDSFPGAGASVQGSVFAERDLQRPGERAFARPMARAARANCCTSEPSELI